MPTITTTSEETINIEIEVTNQELEKLSDEIMQSPQEYACSKTKEIVLRVGETYVKYWTKVP